MSTKPSRVTVRDNVGGELAFPAAGAADYFNDAESQAEQQYSEDIAKWYSGNVENVDDYADFPTAVSSIGATVTTLLIDSVKTVASNVTVPATLTLHFKGAGQLSVNTSITVTINGPVLAAQNQIFAGAGTVTLGAIAKTFSFNKWYGAGDSVRDIILGGNAWPSFSVHLGGTNQTGNGPGWEKVLWNTEEFDTNNNFDSSTNHRFQPSVAGKYQLNASVFFLNAIANNEIVVSIYKNGAAYKYITHRVYASTSTNQSGFLSTVVDANGSTDFFEVWAQSGGDRDIGGLSVESWFAGCRVG